MLSQVLASTIGDLNSWPGFVKRGNLAQYGTPHHTYQAAKQSIEPLWRAELPAPTRTLIGYLKIAEDGNVQGTFVDS